MSKHWQVEFKKNFTEASPLLYNRFPFPYRREGEDKGEGYIKTKTVTTTEELEVQSDWYNRIAKEIGLLKDSLSQKDYKKYKLELLLRLARRVDSFSTICGECQLFKQEITSLSQDLANLGQMPDKERRKSYFKTIGNIVKHLQKEHKLVTKGQYIGIGLAIGVGIGAVLGAALGNPGIGPAIGTAIGLAIGSYLDKKAKDEGRVI